MVETLQLIPRGFAFRAFCVTMDAAPIWFWLRAPG